MIRTLPLRSAPFVTALLFFSACRGGTDVCDASDPLCASGGVPSLSIADASAAEGSGDLQSLTVTVTLSAAASSTVTVDYATGDGTAVAPLDYASTSGTLSFPAGVTTREISVPLWPDVFDEGPDETFAVTLSSPSGATLADGAAVATITEDDGCALTGAIAPGATVATALDATDCVFDTGERLEMWLLDLSEATDVVIDQVSDEIDAHLVLWETDGAEVEEDGDDHFGTNARIARTLPAGRYLVVATSSAAAEEGAFDLSVNLEIYGATASRDASSDLHAIDAATGTATLIGPIGFEHVSAIDFHPTTGVLYGLGERSVADTTKVLITIDPSTGAGAEVGPVGLVSRYKFTGMSFRDDGVLFAYHGEATAHAIYTLDVATGAGTLVGANGLSLSGGNGLVFDAAGTLYHSNQEQTSTIDQTSGAAATLSAWTPPAGCDFGRVGGADRPPTGRTIYGVVKCDPGTSSAEVLATLDYPAGTATEIGPTTTDMDALAIR